MSGGRGLRHTKTFFGVDFLSLGSIVSPIWIFSVVWFKVFISGDVVDPYGLLKTSKKPRNLKTSNKDHETDYKEVTPSTEDKRSCYPGRAPRVSILSRLRCDCVEVPPEVETVNRP